MKDDIVKNWCTNNHRFLVRGQKHLESVEVLLLTLIKHELAILLADTPHAAYANFDHIKVSLALGALHPELGAAGIHYAQVSAKPLSPQGAAALACIEDACAGYELTA